MIGHSKPFCELPEVEASLGPDDPPSSRALPHHANMLMLPPLLALALVRPLVIVPRATAVMTASASTAEDAAGWDEFEA